MVALADSGLSITEQQILFMPVQNQTFEVVEVLDVKNPGLQPQDVQLVLPQGYQGLSVSGDKQAGKQVSGQTLTLPKWATPNTTTRITMTFVLPLNGQTGVQTTLHTNYPVLVAHLYLPVGGSALSAPGLMPDTQTQTISGTTFRVFTRPGIPAGDNWPLSLELLPKASQAPSISGLPIIGMSDQSTGNTLQALGNLVIAGGILVIGLLSIRSTQWGRSARSPVSQEEALYRAWESVEWQHQQGMLEEDQFMKKRSQLKRKLAELKIADRKGEH